MVALTPASAPRRFPGRQPALDGLRGLAILWVCAFHGYALLASPAGNPFGRAAPGTPAALAEVGLLGVQLFFVLSGFLLALPWLRAAAGQGPQPVAARFYRRRAQRLLPAWGLHLALLFGVVLPLVHGGYWLLGSELGWLNLAAHGVLAQFLHPGSASSLGLNMALWSLSLEAQFYLLLPLLAPLFTGRRVWLALPLAVIIALAWKTWAPGLLVPWLFEVVPPPLLVWFDPVSSQPQPYPAPVLALFVERQLPGEFIAFAFGMAAANLSVRLDHRGSSSGPGSGSRPASGWLLRRPTVLPDVIGLALLLGWALVLTQVSFATVVSGPAWRLLGMPLLLASIAALTLIAARDRPLLRYSLGNPLLAGLGLISYSLFLWHEPVLRLVARFVAPTGEWGMPTAAVAGDGLRIGIAIGAVLLVALVSFLLTERPWLRRPDAKRLPKRWRGGF